MLWIMFALLLVAVLAIVVGRHANQLSDSEMACELIAGFCIFALFGCLIAIPIHRAVTRENYIEFLVTRDVVETARARGTDIESAALQMKIMEANQWLASAQYWNAHRFDIYIQDDLISLEPIR